MTKDQIVPKVKEVLGRSQFMCLLPSEITDDLVIGGVLMGSEDIQLELAFALGDLGIDEMHTISLDMTFGELITVLEDVYDRQQVHF